MSDLKVTIVQSGLHWEDPISNRNHIGNLLEQVPSPVDIVLLPEMFTTGFSMRKEAVAEEHSEQMNTLEWMRTHAKKLDAVLCGSVSVKENDHYYNRLYFVRPDGSYSTYDKRHTFSFAKENEHYDNGSKRLIEQWRGWKICPLICYDLRFPVWSRNGLTNDAPDYDVLIYVANWPEVRREPWMKLLPARAIENQVYVAACNRVGEDGNGITYSGDSMLINPRGEVLGVGAHSIEQLISVTFSKSELEDFRKKFPVLHDADNFELKS